MNAETASVPARKTERRVGEGGETHGDVVVAAIGTDLDFVVNGLGVAKSRRIMLVDEIQRWVANNTSVRGLIFCRAFPVASAQPVELAIEADRFHQSKIVFLKSSPSSRIQIHRSRQRILFTPCLTSLGLFLSGIIGGRVVVSAEDGRRRREE